jgi:DivIVA domain-containing protein
MAGHDHHFDDPDGERAQPFLYYRSPDDIRQETFSQRRRGLDEAEVGEYLDLLADQVEAADRERTKLFDELDRLRAENEQLITEVTRLRATPAPAAPPPAAPAPPAATPLSSQLLDEHAQASLVLSRAQEVADQLVAEAQRHVRDLVAQARAEEREVLRDARERAYVQLRQVFSELDGRLDRLGEATGAVPDPPLMILGR